MQFLVSCEHSSSKVPKEFRTLIPADVLKTHRGFDIGALDLAQDLAKGLEVDLYCGEVSRLLIELNRSLHHRNLFSKYTKVLPKNEKQEIINRYYLPYRETVMMAIDQMVVTNQTVVHLSIHTFTPVLDAAVRTADIGFLYDPKREQERALCQKWKLLLPQYQTKSNYPYSGTMDGFTTFLRKRYPAKSYLGIELEVNQKFPLGDSNQWQSLKKSVVETAKIVLK